MGSKRGMVADALTPFAHDKGLLFGEGCFI